MVSVLVIRPITGWSAAMAAVPKVAMAAAMLRVLRRFMVSPWDRGGSGLPARDKVCGWELGRGTGVVREDQEVSFRPWTAS
ncbi:hypothetical protein CATMQ487_33700 [Sphaerotilus microaerophilus]|uniref:Secreted protein n=1 Tax=Sphaerotilus microaerophilus TaxID=2914710 RepID=A0ABN6PRC0_9BURK|nr:hypothetical protein CATMQ487_33700 [Sphaerotilus sp. FB-5]